MSATLRVDIIAETVAWQNAMNQATEGQWVSDDTGGQDLAVFAGRACYQSWSRPNPATASTEGYLRHILEVGHDSVLRHATITAYIQGVSRSLTHELIRHHVGIDFSQLSQRYVDVEKMDYVVPPAFRGDQFLEERQKFVWDAGVAQYKMAVERLETQGKTRKQAREAARAFLPNCAETKIVVTANIQAWRNFIQQRATAHADAEIRELAVEMFTLLSGDAPHFFQDMHLVIVDGVQVVALR